jgi:hypothetical protein
MTDFNTITMKTNYFIRPVLLSLFLLVAFLSVKAQQAAQAPITLDTAKIKYNQISSANKLSVFPAKNQSQQKQKEDEYACYNWAKEQSGIDPLNPPKVEAPPPETGPTGGAVVGAAKGAAAGVAIGAIAGDAGKGAAIGATAGAIAGRRAGKQAQAQQNQQAQSTAKKTEEEMKNSFTKAFSACMEGKGYTVK